MAKSSFIFRFLQNHENMLFGTVYVGGSSPNIPNTYSDIVIKLRQDGPKHQYYGMKWNGKWLFTESGELVSQKEITKRDLHPQLYDEACGIEEGYHPQDQSSGEYGRDKSTKKRYGRAWKRIRDKYAAEHPFCELCFERGIIVPTEEIHHKLPLSEGGTHDRSNLIALCKSCHSRIYAERGDRWGKHPEGE